MWATGINITAAVLLGTPREMGGYGFSLKASGFLYLYVTYLVITLLTLQQMANAVIPLAPQQSVSRWAS